MAEGAKIGGGDSGVRVGGPEYMWRWGGRGSVDEGGGNTDEGVEVDAEGAMGAEAEGGGGGRRQRGGLDKNGVPRIWGSVSGSAARTCPPCVYEPFL